MIVSSWNKDLYPDHVAFLKKLHDKGLKTSLNTHPADGIRPFEESYKRICKALGRNPDTKDVCPARFVQVVKQARLIMCVIASRI